MTLSIIPKKSLGQHFLKDANIRDKIINQLDATAEDHVVEIGPGTGALTGHLAARYPTLEAVELDDRAVAHLKERFPDLKVHLGDVVKYDWVAHAEAAGGKLHIVGNLPYYVTSQVVFGLLDAHTHIAEAVLMMQREVAERLVAKPRTKAYGILSVAVQQLVVPQLAFRVSRNVFYPKPDVESAVVHLVFKDNPADLGSIDAAWLRKVVRTAFNQRRKTLRNSLSRITSECSQEIPEEWRMKRAEELSPEEFIALAQHLKG
ncbi:MAG: 16S rRNA (adenine(1518)-N(6)/adenine(1519)-N(6))-dimethyltransferase RsmA [Rhodothermales bacterium]